MMMEVLAAVPGAAAGEDLVDAAREALAAIAASAREAYGPGQNMRVRSSGVVHAVTLTIWLQGLRLPGPACMVGVAGWDPFAAHPERGEVTCRRCLRLVDAHPEVGVDQLALFDAGDAPA